MKRLIILMILVLSFNTCQNDDNFALDYYRELTQVNNELIYQVHLALEETKRLMLSQPLLTDKEKEAEFEKLKNSFDSIGRICERNISALEKIGPLGNDSILYNSFLQTLTLIQNINRNEFSNFLMHFHSGDMNAGRINALYSASIKLANNHMIRIDSILEFNNRYKLNLDTLELVLSKSKAEKFNTNISVMHNSILLSGSSVDGYGQIRDVDGALYTGYFKDGLFHGKGRLEYENGDTYEGEFFKGTFHGYGIYRWKNGSEYKGQWREDLYNGIGTMVNAKGDTTFGYWLNGILTDI